MPGPQVCYAITLLGQRQAQADNLADQLTTQGVMAPFETTWEEMAAIRASRAPGEVISLEDKVKLRRR